jgi:signal transduction histidine kinase
LLVGAVVSLVFAALLASYVARPIRRLRMALREAASGKLAPGLAASMGRRNDELTELCRDFDHMAGRLAQLMEGQRRLLYDVSHELRSPLARLTAVIGLMRQQPDRVEDCLARLERESERMDRLLSELLTLSRLESGMVERSTELVDLAEVLGDVVSDAMPEAEQAGCEVVFQAAPESLPVHGNAELLHRVFDNLLRNALKHAVAGRWVRIGARIHESEIIVQVEDRGPGVLSGELDQIFRPFYRGSHSASGNGYGLGLVIARQIVENHGGRIDAENRPEGGLRVAVTLPLAEL